MASSLWLRRLGSHDSTAFRSVSECTPEAEDSPDASPHLATSTTASGWSSSSPPPDDVAGYPSETSPAGDAPSVRSQSQQTNWLKRLGSNVGWSSAGDSSDGVESSNLTAKISHGAWSPGRLTIRHSSSGDADDQKAGINTFKQTLQRHPHLDKGSRWPHLIAEDCNLGSPVFCLDVHVARSRLASFAVGYGSGEVRYINKVPEKGVDAAFRGAKEWPVAYRHQQGEDVSGPPRVTCLAFSPSGEWLASSSWDGKVMLFHVERQVLFRTERLIGGQFEPFPQINHESCTNQVAWDADSSILATAVSRVRKFQGVTHRDRIPGALVTIRVPTDFENCQHEDLDHDASYDPDQEYEIYTLHTWTGVWGRRAEDASEVDLKACWCVAIVTVTEDLAPAVATIMGRYEPEEEGRTSRQRAFSSFLSVKSGGLLEHTMSKSMEPTDPDEPALGKFLVAVGCANAEVKVYHTGGFHEAHGKALPSFHQVASLVGHHVVSTNGGVWDVCFLPRDGDEGGKSIRIASAGEDHTVLVWDVRSESVLSVLAQPSLGFGITRIRCYVDRKPWGVTKEQKLVQRVFQECCPERTIDATGRMAWKKGGRTYSGCELEVRNPVSSRLHCCKKVMIVAAAWDNSLRLWDVDSASVESVHSNIHTDAIFDVSLLVSYHMDMACTMLRCFTVSRDKTIKFWNYEIGSLEVKQRIHERAVVGLTILSPPHTPSSFVVVTGSTDGNLCAMDPVTGDKLAQLTADSGSICSVTSPCSLGGALAYGDNAGCARVHVPEWPAAGGVDFGEERFCVPHTEPRGLGHEVHAVSWVLRGRDSDGKPSYLLAFACSCKQLCLWPFGSPAAPSVEVLQSPQRSLCSVEALPPSRGRGAFAGKLLSGGEDGIISLWRVQDGGPQGSQDSEYGLQATGELRGHSNAVVTLRLAKDGLHCASGSWDNSVILWHLLSRTMVRVLSGHRRNVTAVAFDPYTGDIFSSSWDQGLFVWDAATGRVKRMLLGHEHPIGALSITSDGRVMASADASGTVIVRPLSASSSLFFSWRSFLLLMANLKKDAANHATGCAQHLEAFIQPGEPGGVCHSMLFPFRTTLLHYFAMTGNRDGIRCCYADKQDSARGGGVRTTWIGFKRDCFNRLPIDWALDRGHMDCVDELLYQASSYPWQMAETFSKSLVLICSRSVETGHKLRHLPTFLDSRLLPPLSLTSSIPYMQHVQELPSFIVSGLDSPTLSVKDYCDFFGVAASSFSTEAADSGSRVDVQVLYLPDILRCIVNMKSDLGVSPGDLDTDTIECMVWRAMTDYIWRHLYQRMYVQECVMFICFLAVNASYFYHWKNYRGERADTTKYTLGSLVLCGSSSYLRVECTQLLQLRAGYFLSIWNIIQLLGFALSSGFVVRDFVRGEETGRPAEGGEGEPGMALVASVASLLLILNLLYYLRGIVGLGIAIKLYMRIISSVKYIVLLFGVISVAFMWALYMLWRMEGASPNDDYTGITSGFHMIDLMTSMGMVGEDRVPHIMETIEHIPGVLKVATWVISGLYVFLSTIVLMNLMIAVMNNEYTSIVNYSLIEAKRERYAIMDDLRDSVRRDSSHWWNCGWGCGWAGRRKFHLPRYLAVFSRSTKNDFYGYDGIDNDALQQQQQLADQLSPGPAVSSDLDLCIMSRTVSHFRELERRLREWRERRMAATGSDKAQNAVSAHVRCLEHELRRLQNENGRLQQAHLNRLCPQITNRCLNAYLKAPAA